MKKKLFIAIGRIVIYLKKIISFFVKQYQFSQFQQVGTGVYIGNDCTFTKNISIGNDVYIGAECRFQSVHGEIKIGDHVMFGPGVHIHGGNHKFDRVGYFMKENHDKKQGEDGFVIIEDDVWIGANAIILKGLKIGRGSIIGAGAIVSKDVPPYSIFTGVPNSKLRQRWDDETIKEHENIFKERGLTS